MSPNNPSTVGADAIRAAYTGIFQAVAFDTELTVEEIVQVASNWAFVRTSSNGHVIVNAIKQRVPDANHELFIFQKGDDNARQIARDYEPTASVRAWRGLSAIEVIGIARNAIVAPRPLAPYA
jgi:ketosteroid isomerase-like protein